MTPFKHWEQWDGIGYPSERFDSVIYYYPGRVDIENQDNLDNLVNELHQDGIAESKSEARSMLDRAIVIHGQVTEVDGELHCLFGNKQDGESLKKTIDATWVEIDNDE